MEHEARTYSLSARPPADDDRSARTTVDRPPRPCDRSVSTRPGQLAECFALDYLSCDEDDPIVVAFALEPYLARRSDALLGWLTQGRQGPVAGSACLGAGEVPSTATGSRSHVRVLVEVFTRVV
ncbi:hypothetical protein HBB16_02485 [Pseudonocardia sp. MCCB 268]|nr:hypothetical protein [Pseudonocardia cytotoxica]